MPEIRLNATEIIHHEVVLDLSQTTIDMLEEIDEDDRNKYIKGYLCAGTAHQTRTDTDWDDFEMVLI